jgi:hypothetical protein
MIRFKEDKLEVEFEQVDSRLQVIAYSLAGFIAHKFDKDFIITSIYRSGNDFSVHAYWRGLDFRVQQAGKKSYFTKEEQDSIVDYCEQFLYDTRREKRRFKTLKIHGSVLHGHLQVNALDSTKIVYEQVDA